MSLHQQKYPIGEFINPEGTTQAEIKEWIDEIEKFPSIIKAVVINLNNDQLNTPYRDGGWTVEQVVHHCGDSHMNGFIRTKLALTEEKPTIKPYMEALWAELADGRNYPIEKSLNIIELIHEKWVYVLRSLKLEQFNRTYIHPEYNTEFTLAQSIASYAWHCKHHLAHITSLIERKDWK